MKYKIYLDDYRTPIENDWIIVRTYEEFISKITEIGIENIEIIMVDHDLGDQAMTEFHTNVIVNFELDYNNIQEKTGLDCVKWLIKYYLDNYTSKINFPQILTQSFNPIGSANIIGYVNAFLMSIGRLQTCNRLFIPYK